MSGNAPTMKLGVKLRIAPADSCLGTAVMRALRPATLLPRLGLAGAGLVATAIVFAAGGGLVAFGLWPEQRGQADQQRLVLAGAVEQAVGGRQSSNRPRDRSIAQRRRTVAASAGVLREVDQTSPRIVLPQKPAPNTPGPHVPQRPEPVLPRPAVAEPARPLEPVAEAVGETTSVLATSVRDAATVLAHGFAAISPAAAPVVTHAGEALAVTVGDSGRAVGDMLRGGPGH